MRFRRKINEIERSGRRSQTARIKDSRDLISIFFDYLRGDSAGYIGLRWRYEIYSGNIFDYRYK